MKVLVFGASGSIGGAICKHFAKYAIALPVFRKTPVNLEDYQNIIIADVLLGKMEGLEKHSNYDAVIFAQGTNLNDSILTFSEDENLEMYKANCLFIMKAMNFLLEKDLLNSKANIVVISSIWQNIVRKNKLSYCVTKAAVGGVVRSLSVDLASYNGKQCLVNAVLPGCNSNTNDHKKPFTKPN
jgi:3-oxoacyl-[acyl-carrier protein] reductase